MDPELNDEDVPSGADDDGNTESRRARTLIFLVAAGFLVVGGLNVGLYWFKCHHNREPMSIPHCLALSIPLVIGLAIVLMSSALARAINEYLDE